MPRQCDACRTINLVGYDPCWTLLLDWCSQPESTSPSVRCSVTCTGWECRNELISSWRCSRIVVSIRRLRHILPMNSAEWRTQTRDGGWGQHQSRHSSYRRCAIPLLATAHFRPRLCAYRTACRPASPFRRHWQLSGGASKQNPISDVLARTVPDDSHVVILYAWLRTCHFCCKVFLQS